MGRIVNEVNGNLILLLAATAPELGRILIAPPEHDKFAYASEEKQLRPAI